MSPRAPEQDPRDPRIGTWRAELEGSPDRTRRAIVQYELAHLLENGLGDVQAALPHYVAAREASPTFRLPLFALIRIHERSRRLEPLVELYRAEARASSSSPEHEASALVDQAVLLEDHLKRAREAKPLYETALSKHPASQVAALMLELHMRRAGDRKAIARIVAHRAQQVTEPVLKRLLALEVAIGKADDGDVDGALELLRGAMSVPLERWRFLEELERIARKHGRAADVLLAVEKMAQLAEARARGDSIGQGMSPGTLPPFANEAVARVHAAVLFHELSRIRRRENDVAGALEAVERALTMRPDDLLLRQERLDLLEQKGDRGGALEAARDLARRAGTGSYAAALQLRIADLVPSGDRRGKRAALEAAAKAAPTSPAALGVLHAELAVVGTADRIAWLEQRALGRTDGTQGRVLWEAAQIAADTLGDAERAKRLYVAAAEQSEDRASILREMHGACDRLGVDADEAAVLLLGATTDADERAYLLHERLVARGGDPGATATMLRELLHEEPPPEWAPDAARLHGALTRDVALLADAHRAIAARAAEPLVAAAHLCAAGRALARGGARDAAVDVLHEALERAPGHDYALALLEEILRARGDNEAVASLLRSAADAASGARIAEPLLLRAALVAEGAGRADLAAQAYRDAAARHPSSAAAPFALLRLAQSVRDGSLELEALEALAKQESAMGPAGRWAFVLGEHHDLVTRNAEDAQTWLRAALGDERVGPAAAIALVLSPHCRAAHLDALEQLAGMAHGLGGAGVRRALGALLFESDTDTGRVQKVVSRILELHPDDRWALWAKLRLAGLEPAGGGARASALETLARATSDAELAAELLLYAGWTRAIAGGDAAGPMLAATIEEVAKRDPGSLLATVALDETWILPHDRTRAIEAIGSRLSHTPDQTALPLRAALGRALVADGRFSEAADILTPLVGNDAEDLASWEALLVAARREGRWIEVVAACDKLATACDGVERARLLEEAGIVLAEKLGGREDAEPRLRAAITADPSRSSAYAWLHDLLLEREDAEGLLTIVTKRIDVVDDPDQLVELLYEQAQLRDALGDRERAFDSLKILHAIDETQPGPLALMAQTAVHLGRWSEAVDALRALANCEIEKEHRREARIAAAQILDRKLQSTRAALAELQALEQLGVADEELFVQIGEIAEDAGLHEEAVTAFRRAASFAGGGRRAELERRAAGLLGSKQETAAAADALKRALAADPTDVDAADALAKILPPAERHAMAGRFEAAVRAELVADPTNAGVLRKLRRAAVWRDDGDLEQRVLSALVAVGAASSEEQEALSSFTSALPRGALSGASLKALRAGGDPGPLSEVVAQLEETIVAVDGLDPKTLGVARDGLVKPRDDNPLRDDVLSIAGLFGVGEERFFTGASGAAIHVAPGGADAPTWIVGDMVTAPLAPALRYDTGRIAMAARLHVIPIAKRAVEDGAALIAAAAIAADQPLDGAAPQGTDALVGPMRKHLTRKAKKAIPDAIRGRGVDAHAARLFCAGVQRTLARAGVLACGDLYVALERILGAAPNAERIRYSDEARDVLAFWVSTELGALRRELGAEAQGSRRAEEPARGADPVDSLEAAAARLAASATFDEQPRQRREGPPIVIDGLADAVMTDHPAGSSDDAASASAEALEHPSEERRAELLVQLAKRATRTARARVLLAASELFESSGNASRARELELLAREADPRDVLALRRVRRAAARRGALGEVLELLQIESTLPISPEERAFALSLGAIFALFQPDLAAAESFASRAQKIRPHSAATSLLLGEIQLARQRRAEAFNSLERAASVWKDAEGAAALLCEVSVAAERDGDVRRARRLFKQSAKLDPSALDALLGAARTARAQPEIDDAIEMARAAAEQVSDPRVRAGLLRAAARVAHRLANRPADAVAILASASDVPAIDARADAAEAAGDTKALAAALTKWADGARRTERAIAFVRLADVRANEKNLDAAADALREAHRADPTFALIRVASEGLARRAGDVQSLARAARAEGQSALVAAARTALHGDKVDVERKVLEHAASADDDASVTARVLAVDSAAAAGDEPGALALLYAESSRVSPARRPGLLLVIADRHLASNSRRDGVAMLDEVRKVAPGHVPTLRRLARLAARRAPVEAAAFFLEEHATTSGERAAFAATMAARLLEKGGGDAADAYRRALASFPGYGPASWALEELARRSGDAALERELLSGRAEAAADPREAAESWIRAALLSSPPDRTLLARASEAAPDDGVLHELCARQPSIPARERAVLLEGSAAGSSPDQARAIRLRAAFAYEDAGDAAGAAAAARAVNDGGSQTDPFAEAILDRVEPIAGEHERIAERRLRVVQEAPDGVTRALALERLARFELREGGDPSNAPPLLDAILEQYPGHVASRRTLERHYMHSGDDDGLADVAERFATLGQPEDAAAHARLVARLRLAAPDAPPDAADESLCAAFDYVKVDLWLARRVEAAARARGDARLLEQTWDEIAEQLQAPVENLCAELRACEILANVRTPKAAAARLAKVVAGSNEHPLAAEMLGWLQLDAGDWAAGAEALEVAAKQARAPARAIALFTRAGEIWQEQVRDDARATEAFLAAAKSDASKPELFERLARLLAKQGQVEKLVELANARLKAGADKATQIHIHMMLGDLYTQMADLNAAKKSLRTVAALAPDRIDVLERLARVCQLDEDLRGAADALQRICKAVQDPKQLRTAFLQLGDLYTRSKDVRQAESVYNQMLSKFPNDPTATERLAALQRLRTGG